MLMLITTTFADVTIVATTAAYATVHIFVTAATDVVGTTVITFPTSPLFFLSSQPFRPLLAVYLLSLPALLKPPLPTLTFPCLLPPLTQVHTRLQVSSPPISTPDSHASVT